MIQTQEYITFHSFDCGPVPAEVNISCFHGSEGVDEYHLMVRPTQYGYIATQLSWIQAAYKSVLHSFGIDTGTCIFKRLFCSDLPNQISTIETNALAGFQNYDDPCAISLVRQPPVPPAKVAMWAYHIYDHKRKLNKNKNGNTLFLKRGNLTHLWTTGITNIDNNSSYVQTETILKKYIGHLKSYNLNLADNLIRTWFFVQNVDANYQGFVEARRDIFQKQGLTPETHFIASTGIEGTSSDVNAKVLMDAYAISGVHSEQIKYLSALDWLGPTHKYGVTFERGTSVAYYDRKHIFISGTASIDNIGNILNSGNILKQLDRALENVEALLKQAESTFRNVCVYIVYVRDIIDLDIVQSSMRVRFGDAPIQVVAAPVCRPGWLVELECIGNVPAFNPDLPKF